MDAGGGGGDAGLTVFVQLDFEFEQKMKETQHTLKSIHLANERAVWVREPEHRATNVTVFLDAELYRDRVGATSIIDALNSKGDIDSSLFVFVSMESAASRWVECPCYPPFAQFIEEELFPWLERAYLRAHEAQERVIAGLSYTGLAAAYVSMMNLSRFHEGDRPVRLILVKRLLDYRLF